MEPRRGDGRRSRRPQEYSADAVFQMNEIHGLRRKIRYPRPPSRAVDQFEERRFLSGPSGRDSRVIRTDRRPSRGISVRFGSGPQQDHAGLHAGDVSDRHHESPRSRGTSSICAAAIDSRSRTPLAARLRRSESSSVIEDRPVTRSRRSVPERRSAARSLGRLKEDLESCGLDVASDSGGSGRDEAYSRPQGASILGGVPSASSQPPEMGRKDRDLVAFTLIVGYFSEWSFSTISRPTHPWNSM